MARPLAEFTLERQRRAQGDEIYQGLEHGRYSLSPPITRFAAGGTRPGDPKRPAPKGTGRIRTRGTTLVVAYGDHSFRGTPVRVMPLPALTGASVRAYWGRAT